MGHSQSKNNKKENRIVVSEEYFIKNGGILLEKQIALSQGKEKRATPLKIYSIKDIERATNQYDQVLLLADIRWAIYKGTLDDRTVAIKAFRDLKLFPHLIDQFLNEVATVMVMNHSNFTKLHGCCLESYVPILVYEYLQNGGLFNQLHGVTTSHKGLKWTYRLRIATDVSYALCYMHTAFSKPVVHRDVKSRSVLIDESFHAKLINLGYSVSITPGDTSQKWPVRGTIGYLDPEYIETEEVTEKCDVYSFGVLMIELLTGRAPKELAMSGTDLVNVFSTSIVNNFMAEIIDSDVLKQASIDELQSMTQLALACVKSKGVERPSMTEVVKELWLIHLYKDNGVV